MHSLMEEINLMDTVEAKIFKAPVDQSFRLNEEINDYILAMIRRGKRFAGKASENVRNEGVEYVVVEVCFQAKV